MTDIQVIAFDADDTLWINEPHYQKAEDKFSAMMIDFLPKHGISKELLTIEIANIPHYGYGAKSFMLSMIEAAIKISNNKISTKAIQQIIEIGKDLIDEPIEVLDGVKDVLDTLKSSYRLIMATKGDLLDQEKKLAKSGLSEFFHHTEIVSEKNEAEYTRIIKHLDVQPDNFVMIGNSLKSDIIPIINIGGYGFHVPYKTTWEYEKVDVQIDDPKFKKLDHIKDVLNHL